MTTLPAFAGPSDALAMAGELKQPDIRVWRASGRLVISEAARLNADQLGLFAGANQQGFGRTDVQMLVQRFPVAKGDSPDLLSRELLMSAVPVARDSRLHQLTEALGSGLRANPMVMPTVWLYELANSELFIATDGPEGAVGDSAAGPEGAVMVWHDRHTAEWFAAVHGVRGTITSIAGGELFDRFDRTSPQWLVLNPRMEGSVLIPPPLIAAMQWTYFNNADAANESADNTYLNWAISECKAGREHATWLIDALLVSNVHVAVASTEPLRPVIAGNTSHRVLNVYVEAQSAISAARGAGPTASFVTMSGPDALRLAVRLGVEDFRIVAEEASFVYTANNVKGLLVINEDLRESRL